MNLGPLYPDRRDPSFIEAVLQLLGHVLGGAALFLGLAAVAWGIGWAVDALNKLHPFNATVIELLHGVEVAILYLDIALSVIVLLVGAFRFVRELAVPAR
jgi:hypothetical protein